MNSEKLRLKEHRNDSKLIVKKCHVCGTIMESSSEIKKCSGCKKSFLPTNYFSKVHAKNSEEFDNLFATSDELLETDLIRGIAVLW
jgi:heterodisulfide reductase subunit B